MNENTQQNGAEAAATPAPAAVQVAKKDYGSIVVELVKKRMDEGMTLPENYNAINAIKCTMIALSDLCDRNGRHFTEVCTPASIQTALFDMVTKGLDVSKGQGYMCIRGNKLCFDDEYFGKTCQVRRIYPNWQPSTHVVYEGDKFEYGIDPETGYMKLIKHEQKLANRDPNKWVGGYVYLPTADGNRDLYVMSRYEVEAAWSQSSNKGLTVHKKFLEKMVGKTLINSGLTLILNSSDSIAPTGVPGDAPEAVAGDGEAVEVIDVTATPVLESEPAEVIAPDGGSDGAGGAESEGKLFEV